jgi:enoyl-[acyl-carrier protein] reductase III
MAGHPRSALVTGATRGIGRAVARRLAENHNIVVAYRAEKDEAERAAAEFRALGAEVLVQAADIADPSSLRELAAAGLERFGRIDTLVANAATGHHRPLSASSWEHIQQSVQVIAGSFVELVSLLSPQMQPGGRIVAISGLDRVFAVADHGLCGAGKAALESIVRNLAVELGPRGITANTVTPGATRTDSMKRAMERSPGAEAPLVACIPAGRLGEPEDVAGVVAFLCSPDAAFVNGTTILVDGGFTAGTIWTSRQHDSMARGVWSDRLLGQ